MSSTARNIIDLNAYGPQGERHREQPVDLGAAIAKFQGELAKAGYGSPEIEADGRIHRFDLPEEARGKKSGWYLLFPDGIPAGRFGNWKEGSSIPWCSKARCEMTAAECAEHDQRMELAKNERDAKRKQEADTAAKEAVAVLASAPDATDDHPYLAKKRVRSFGLKIGKYGNALVPFRDAAGNVRGYQRITTTGEKLFQPGASVTGNFYLITGDMSTVFVCEGYATGASIHMATGQAVVVAFNADNLDAATASAKQAFLGAKFVIAADDDRWTKTPKGEPWNPGQVKAGEAAAKHCLPMVTPAFKDLSTKPTDWNDLHALEDIEAVRVQLAQAGRVSTRDKLRALTVKKEYVAMIGNEEWVYQNLLVKGQITTIIAMSGGGKTTIHYDFIVPWIIEHHDTMIIFYFDCDSPTSDHKRMHRRAQRIGPRLQWINPLTHGKGPEVLVEYLNEFVASGERLDDALFVLDTLKKFIDLLDKKSVKPFFCLLRQLTALGATVVLLGHANKHRDVDGNLVFEGVGDVKSDTDAMIIFERMKAADDGIDITTVVDPGKGAKVRGLYKQISFHIAPDRTVTLCRDVVPVPDWKATSAKNNKLSDEEIRDRIRDFLLEQSEPVNQVSITDHFMSVPGVSYHRVRGVLQACAISEYHAKPGQIFIRDEGTHNRKSYGVMS